MTSLILPRGQRLQMEAEARAAFPRECCGLVEGMRVGGAIVVMAVHPSPNRAATPDAFEIDPALQIRLLRELRGTGREIVGCYHSHPNGASDPSPRDRAGAAEAGAVWLITALSRESAATRAFLFDGSDFQPLPITPTASLDPARGPRL